MIAAESIGFMPPEGVSMILGDMTSRDYPPFDCVKGQRTKKKIKYSNKSDYQLALMFQSQDEVLTIKEKSIDVFPKCKKISIWKLMPSLN